MEDNLKIFITVSFVIHASIFTAFSMHSRRSSYIVLPIDLILNNPVQEENTPNGARLQSPPPQEIKKKKEKEIVIPKKIKAEKEPPPKKAEPEQKEETKPQPAQPQPAAPAKAQASGFSGAINVDTAHFPYTYYTNLIVKKIGRNWQWSNEFGRLKSVVYFKIQKEGTVSEVNLKDSSGDNLFDEQAQRAVRMASPFPPLPEGYTENDLGVYFEFSFKE